MEPDGVSRRDLLMGAAGAAAIATSGFAAVLYKSGFSEQALDLPFGNPDATSDVRLTPTACTADAATTSYSEGPFYSPRSPFKPDLREPGTSGDEMALTGRVVDTDCVPVAGAVLDFWQVDEHARYDNSGNRYRGHLHTDRDGVFELRSIHPVPYSTQGFWQTAHLHVKVQGPNTRLLTTQLFFPRYASENPLDDGFTPELEVTGDRDADGVYAFRFDFVLERR